MSKKDELYVVSKCLSHPFGGPYLSFFHFKGFYKLIKLTGIVVLDQDTRSFKEGDDYILKLREIKIEKSLLWGQLIYKKNLLECCWP